MKRGKEGHVCFTNTHKKKGKIPRPPAREIGSISRWHLPDLNFMPNNERTYHLISGQYYKLQLENRDLGRITLWYSNYKKDLHSLGRRMALRMAFQAMAKPSREEFVTAFFFPIDDDSLISLLYSFIPDRQRDRFLSHVWVFCPFVNFEVGK